ncbi:uncharacterized protein LOC134826898 [Culicoides brevitarsis]|uniref:uncharacterized protein LOC134826898 n=1 Tax=Culicoides brevitarsis TaxID=469753 RepID=UPI00307C060E
MGSSCLLAAKWTLFTVVLVLFFLPRNGNCQNVQPVNFNAVDHFERQTRGRVCGPDLSMNVEYLCRNYFVKKEKRHVSPKMRVMFPTITDFEYDEKEDENDMMPPSMNNFDFQPFLKKMYGNIWKSGKRTGRHRQSLVTECCQKSCTTAEMIGYCDGKGGLKSYNDDDK